MSAPQTILRSQITNLSGEAITVVVTVRPYADRDDHEYRVFIDGGMLSNGDEQFVHHDFEEVLEIVNRETRAYLAADLAD
jgi:hypothetical protein